MTNRREIAASITSSVVKYYTKKRFCVNAELGLQSRRLGMLRADVLALNMKHEIVIVEVKSSIADFKTDQKYHLYLPFCNKMYIACQPKLYEKIKDSVNEDVGIMVVQDNGKLKVAKNAKSRIVDPETLLQILTRLAFRNADHNRYKRRSTR